MKILTIFLILSLCTFNAESFKLKSFMKDFWRATKNGLKNGPSPSSPAPQQQPSWATERIESAEYVTRNKQGSIMQHSPIDHHGIKLITLEGNEYLLHNTPNTGPVVTDANHMSSKWSNIKSIPVSGEKTVGDALGSAGLDMSDSYIGGGTCIGTACRVEKYLKK